MKIMLTLMSISTHMPNPIIKTAFLIKIPISLIQITFSTLLTIPSEKILISHKLNQFNSKLLNNHIQTPCLFKLNISKTNIKQIITNINLNKFKIINSINLKYKLNLNNNSRLNRFLNKAYPKFLRNHTLLKLPHNPNTNISNLNQTSR